MAGIYIHIPFCKKACHYCNFHFSTSLKKKEEMLRAIEKEIIIQQDYLQGETIETIYLGGGTPSLLSQEEIMNIYRQVETYFPLAEELEVSLEANPDDLTEEKIKALSETPINRLSIGIQSFFDEDLEFMNRSHNGSQAKNAIIQAQKYGFQDISIDLIYGTPTTSDTMWQNNLDTAFELKIPHLSSYCLTVESGTALHHFVKKGKALPVNETQAERQFQMLQLATKKQGYEHYEVSNFALPNRYSKHNTAYWQGKKYLGIGPSAHSFNGKSRQWNMAHNLKYIKAIQEQQDFFEIETLSPADRYNEYVMTSLRTQWGCNVEQIKEPFKDFFLEKIKSPLAQGYILQEKNYYIIQPHALFLSDGIAADLFWVE